MISLLCVYAPKHILVAFTLTSATCLAKDPNHKPLQLIVVKFQAQVTKVLMITINQVIAESN